MTFLEFITMRGIPFRPHTKPGELWLQCPFCQDVKFRLGLNWRNNKGRCFNCTWKSRKAIRYVMKAWRLDARIDAPEGDQEAPKAEAPPIHLPEDFFPLAAIQDADGSPFTKARDYMLKRGFSLNQLARHKIGASFTGRYAFRVVIPVFSEAKLCGLVARTWTDREPKYLNSVGEKAIWNLRQLRKEQTMILAEGIFKAMALERISSRSDFRCGALLGHSITEAQIEQLRTNRAHKILVWPDPDPQGIEGAVKVIELLQGSRLQVLVPGRFPEKQADEETRDDLRSLLENRIPVTASLLRKMRLEATKR